MLQCVRADLNALSTVWLDGFAEARMWTRTWIFDVVQLWFSNLLADRFPFYCVLLPRPCFSSSSGIVSLAFLDALSPSGVCLAWDGCGYCGAMAALEPAGQPLWLLSELTGAFVVGGKSRRTCAPTRFGSSPAVHQHTMATTAFFSGRSVAGAETGLPND